MIALFSIFHFQRFATNHFDGSLKDLLRIEEDGAPDDSGSPHIFVKEIDRFESFPHLPKVFPK